MEWGERWERLFADVEAAFEAQERRERDSEIADRTRRDRASVTLDARLCGHRGHRIEARLAGPVAVEGEIVDVGGDWLALAPGPGRLIIVPLGAIASVSGLGPRSEIDRTARRFAIGYALREVSRDRAPVRVRDRWGTTFEGTVDVVGKDFLDLAEHPIDEARRGANVRGRRTIPITAIAFVATM